MQTLFDETGVANAPPYYRWRDERSPLVVEIKIELVSRMLADLQAAEELGLEGGGVLIGCFPKTLGPPTLRIEEFESVGRRGGDGLPYILLAEQRQRFTMIRKRAATRELSAVGYFRSHLRTGAFELSVGDRDLMSAEFRNTIHVALLIAKDQSELGERAQRRHLATYFVSVSGIIQNRVDPTAFPFEVRDLERLASNQPSAFAEKPLRPITTPEEPKETERVGEQPNLEFPIGRRRLGKSGEDPAPGSRARLFLWSAVALLAVLTGVFSFWGWDKQAADVPGVESPLALSVASETSTTLGNQSLHVTWNHSSPLASSATRAVLTIGDRVTHDKIQEVSLGTYDLTAGSLKIDMANRPVEITLVLWMPDSTKVTQLAQPVS